ncbi:MULTISPECIES: hypothetical protein [unclassified Streptomyces]|uniref:hypothetical protein n=1 Tax=unclassified Streptomyces TaxID=2593676 RepID=UPI001661C1FD|nr:MULTISPECIES: hypothetical protein [unclassified Streptomyces]MBD0841161.1 hypothetical protein [Streptomyces sp. TRM68416]
MAETPKITNANEKSMPLDTYLLNPEQSETIDNAYRGIVSDCMKRFGFDYTLSQDPDSGYGDSPTTRIDGRFGRQSAEDAEKWGYHSVGSDTGEDSNPWGGPKLTAGMQTAMNGSSDPKQKFGPGGQVINGEKVPDHGCVGEARKKLTGSVNGNTVDAKLATDLKFDTLTKAQQDKRTRAVFAKWSTCMKGKGFDYADPIEANGDEEWSKTPQPTQHEIQVATADQDCRKKHNVVGVWFAVDYAYQEQAVEQNAEALADVRNGIDDMLKAAATAQAG